MKNLIVLLTLLLTSVCAYSQTRVFTMYKGYCIISGHDPIPWKKKETVKVSDYDDMVMAEHFNEKGVCYTITVGHYERSDSKGKYFTKEDDGFIRTWFISNDRKTAIYTEKHTGMFSKVSTSSYFYSTMSAAQDAANFMQTINSDSRANSSNRYDSRGGANNNSGSHSDYDTCNTCHGSGKCNSCAGRGEKRNPYDNNRLRDCYICKGSGVCPTCHGKGKI